MQEKILIIVAVFGPVLTLCLCACCSCCCRPEQLPVSEGQQQQTQIPIPAATGIVVKFKRISDGATEATCAICLAEFEEEDLCKILAKCKHLYHRDCIDLWLQKNWHCPIYRGPVAVTVTGARL